APLWGLCPAPRRVRVLASRAFRTLFTDAGGDADRQLARGHILGHHGAGTGLGACTDLARRDDHRIDADERAIADRRPMLLGAVEVRGDRAGTDVGVLADLGIAEVAHVVLLRAGAQVAGLELGIVADLGATTDDAARAQVAVRTDGRLVLDDGRLDDRPPDTRAAADRRIDDMGTRPDHAPLTDRGRAAQDHVRLEGDVGLEGDIPVEVHRGRVTHGHPVTHVLLVPADAQVPLRGSELRTVVDVVEPPVVLARDGEHEPAILASETHEVREIQLPGRAGRLERPDPSAQRLRIERVEPGIDLIVRQLLLGRVLY